MSTIDHALLFKGIKYHYKASETAAINFTQDCIIIDTDGSNRSESKFYTGNKKTREVTNHAGWAFVAHSQFDSSILSNLSGSIIDGSEKFGPVVTCSIFTNYFEKGY